MICQNWRCSYHCEGREGSKETGLYVLEVRVCFAVVAGSFCIVLMPTGDSNRCGQLVQLQRTNRNIQELKVSFR